eukprot:Nitzschia sp. Nitz4//scaffold19_size178191//47651//49416//NITZ4_001965-RA/size178191-augustus-gene-0.131-mRNA-1//-1//CDS//3329540643//8945//frame0
MAHRPDSLGGGRRGPIPRPWLASQQHYPYPPPGHPYYAPHLMPGPVGGAPPSRPVDILDKPEWRVGGSLSSFTTESDSSVSDSEEEVEGRNERFNTFDHADLRRQKEVFQRPSIATADPVVGKPPMISNRSRSAGLPPMNPHSSYMMTPPHAPPARNRMDTSDTGFTGFSGTTTTSRHRRRQQFQFSSQSIEQIVRKTAANDEKKVAPPPYVMCQSGGSPMYDSGTFSSWDDSSACLTPQEVSHKKTFSFDSDYTPGYPPSPYDAQPWGKATENIPSRDRPPKAGGRTRRRRSAKAKQSSKPAKKSTAPSESIYLRKDLRLDSMAEGTVVVSGWVAASVGSDKLTPRLFRGEQDLEARDLHYLQIVDVTSTGVGARVFLYSSQGNIQHAFPLQSDWMCQSSEITSRIGRCVTLKSRSSPTSVIASILPVSLDDNFFNNGTLVPPKKFAQMSDRLFVSGKGKVYAPDEQHDAAMFIMFSLDALIKNTWR